jgi:hypothetical protein
MPKESKQTMTPPPELLEQLRTVWLSPPTKAPGTKDAAASIASIDAVRHGGVAVDRCASHILPFNAIESEDPKRPGFIRSDCKLCGRFLGYRPKDYRVNFECHG